MAQYVQNPNLQIPRDHTCRGSLKIQSRSLRGYILEAAESLHVIFRLQV